MRAATGILPAGQGGFSTTEVMNMIGSDERGLMCMVCQRTDAKAYILKNSIMLCEACGSTAEPPGAVAEPPAAQSGESISEIWKCPFCETAMKVSDDGHERGVAVQAHLVERHRYRELDATVEEAPVEKPVPRNWRDRPAWQGSARGRRTAW